jgi:hypothetical protein
MSGGAPLFRPAAVRPSTSISGISGISASVSAASLAPSTHHLAFPSTDSDLAAALRRVDMLSSEGIDEADTQTGDESLDTEEEDDDDDIFSTTSGRRHGAVLQPEMDDWLILEVSAPAREPLPWLAECCCRAMCLPPWHDAGSAVGAPAVADVRAADPIHDALEP